MSWKRLAIVAVLVFALTSVAFAANVMVGFDKVSYQPGDNVTVTGTVTGMTFSGQTLTVVVTPPSGSATTQTGVAINPSTGAFSSSPVTVSTLGTYSVQVFVTSAPSTHGLGVFEVELSKQYALTTNKFSYSVNETATLTLSVQYLNSNGSTSPVASASVPIKIKNETGTTLVEQTLTTNSNGTATLSYQIPNYGKYTAIAGANLANVLFEAPPFAIKASTLGTNGEKKYLYSIDDSLVLQVSATVTSSSGTVTAVKNAAVRATLKDENGNTKSTLTQFTETSDGVYESAATSLNSTSNGKYYLAVEVTKSGLTKTAQVWFEVKSLRVELVPAGPKEEVTGFLKGQEVRLGLNVFDMRNGDKLAAEAITGASFTSCKDANGGNCLTSLGSPALAEGFADFSKLLTFTAPNSTGEYTIGVAVNTTSGVGNGEVFIVVQNIAVYTENRDQFGNYQWRFGPGQQVTVVGRAVGGNWAQKTVSSMEILEVRNQTWDDITSSVFSNSSAATNSSGDRVSFYAPSDSGWFSVKVRVTTSEGDVGQGSGGFEVRLYDVWADLMDASDNWKWQFSSTDVVYLHLNVMDLGGTALSSSSYSVSIDSLRNEITGKTYSNLNTSNVGTDGQDRKVVSLSLAGLGLSSGFYHIQMTVTDTNGNKEHADSWFKVSNLYVQVSTKDSQGQFKSRFGPTDNITFAVTANYFNGSAIPASPVSIQDLLLFQQGPPMPIPADKYNASTANTSSGSASIWLKAQSGKTLPQGDYLAIIKVNASGSVELQESWFQIGVMDATGYAENYIVGTTQNVSLIISAKKVDGTALSNATVTLEKLRDTFSWTDVPGFNVSSVAAATTDSAGAANLKFLASSLPTSQFEATVRVKSTTLGASQDVFIWFQVQDKQLSGSLVDYSKRTVAPGGNVEIWVDVKNPNGSGAAGENISVYQVANTMSWPWSFTDVTTVTTGTTDSQGRAKVIFKAPDAEGTYQPLANVSGTASKDPWALGGASFDVKNSKIGVTLFDNSTGTPVQLDVYSPNSTITTEVNLSNPTGGSLNIAELKLLKYNNINTQEETTLGSTVTSGITSSNYMTFSAPSDQGEYTLFVSVKEGSANKTTIAKRWFRVETFKIGFWMDRWGYSPGGAMSINFDATYPSGSAANVTVQPTLFRNVFTDENVTLPSSQNITGFGTFSMTAPSALGEYEMEFCVYDRGSSCTSGSTRLRMGFSVQSFYINVWPDQPSFTSGDNVTLNFEARDVSGGLLNIDNITQVEFRDEMTWQPVTITNMTNSTDPWMSQRKIIRFPASSLSPGGYMGRFNVTAGSETRQVDTWFRVSDYSVSVDSVPSNPERLFFVGVPITLSISVEPAANTTGTIELKNEQNWQTISTTDFNVTDGAALVNLTVTSSGKYSAWIRVGSAEAFFWFRTGGYKIDVLHGPPGSGMTTDFIGDNENMTVVFDINEPSGSAYSGPVNVSVLEIRNSWNWQLVSSNVFSTNLTAGVGNEQFSFSPGLTTGEYNAIIEFTVGDKTQTEYIWFSVRSKILEAWPIFNGPAFSPGDNVTIQAQLMEPNRTGVPGVNVSIEQVVYRQMWQPISVAYIAQSAITDSNGRVSLSFTLPSNLTGGFDVKIKDNTYNSTTYTGFNVNGYELQFLRTKWSFSSGENFTGDLYVYRSSVPQANVSVRYQLWDQKNWGSPLVSWTSLGVTDSTGKVSVSIPVPSDGDYNVEFDAGNGAANLFEFFRVQSFESWAWVQGNSTGSNDVGPGEQLTITVTAMNPGSSTPITGANATLVEVRDSRNWSPASYTGITTSATTSSSGIAYLSINAPAATGEYIAKINVTSGNSSSETDAWFRVSPYSTSIEFACSGNSSNCDPRRRGAGEAVSVNINVTGITNRLTACVERIRDRFSGIETFTNTCNSTANNSTGSLVLTFTAPSQAGSYDAVFKFWDGTQNSGTMITERWEGFEVVGAGGLWMNAWVEPWQTWPNTNTSVWIEIRSTTGGWDDISDTCSSVSLTELRNSRTWQLITNNLTNQWWPIQGDPGRFGTQLVFTAPNLGGGEYMGRVRAICNSTELTQEIHFQIKSFQVSSVMDEIVESNSVARYWIKIAYANGTALANATVKAKRVMSNFGWVEVANLNQQYTTDANGEFTGNFTTPNQPGDYTLQLEAISGDTTQEINRWFQIKGMNLEVSTLNAGTPTDTFYPGETVTATVRATNAITGEPLANQFINVMLNAYDCGSGSTGGQQSPEMGGEGCMPQWNSTMTDSSGIATFTFSDLAVGGYSIRADVWTDMGGGSAQKEVSVKNFNLGISTNKQVYVPGENITVTLTPTYSNGSAISSFSANVSLFAPSFGSGGDVPLTSRTVSTSPFNLTVPTNATNGPKLIEVEMTAGGAQDSDLVIVIVRSASRINATAITGSRSPRELMDVNLTTTDLNIAIAPMVQHMKRTAGAIPLNEFKGGDPSSGKMNWYESAIYFDAATNATHMKILAQRKSGNYAAVLFVVNKSASTNFFDSFEDMLFIDYTVLGDTTAPPQVASVNASNTQEGQRVTVSWSAVNASDIAKYTVYWNTSAITNVTNWPTNQKKDVTGGTATNVSGLNNSVQYFFAVTAVDLDANENKTIIVNANATPTDTRAPMVYLDSPTFGATVSSPITLVIRAEDWTGIDSIWYDNGTNNSTLENVCQTASGKETCTTNWDISLSEGNYSWFAYANDTGGRLGGAPVNFTVAAGGSPPGGNFTDQANLTTWTGAPNLTDSPDSAPEALNFDTVWVKADPSMLYFKFKLGNLSSPTGGLMQCGGNPAYSPYNTTEYLIHINSQPGGCTSSCVSGTDYQLYADITPSATNITSFFSWNSTISDFDSIHDAFTMTSLNCTARTFEIGIVKYYLNITGPATVNLTFTSSNGTTQFDMVPEPPPWTVSLS